MRLMRACCKCLYAVLMRKPKDIEAGKERLRKCRDETLRNYDAKNGKKAGRIKIDAFALVFYLEFYLYMLLKKKYSIYVCWH
jgi:hypothetical protein